MSYIEKFLDVDLLALSQVRSYKRRIAGKLTDVKAAQRGGPSRGESGGAGGGGKGKQNKVTADQILAARVPGPLSDLQQYLIQERSTAYRDIVEKHMKDHPVTSQEIGLARDTLLATSDYYDGLVNPTLNYVAREKLRLNMQSKRLALRNAIRNRAIARTKPSPWASKEKIARREEQAKARFPEPSEEE